MSICTVEDVKKMTSAISNQLDACDNGQAGECVSLDASLQRYAHFCSEFCTSIRQWAMSVFRGDLPFDADVERLWLGEGDRLFERAVAVLTRSEKTTVNCHDLPGRRMLQASLWEMQKLRSEWVRPKLSVGPAARIKLPPEVVQDAARRVAELEPLPENWEPEDPEQRSLYRKAKSS